MHASRLHQVGTVARFYAGPSATCQACNTCFRTRDRLIRHLCFGSKGCLQHLQASFVPLDADVVQQLDCNAREVSRRSAVDGRRADAEAFLCIPGCCNDLAPIQGSEVSARVPVLCSEDLPGDPKRGVVARHRYMPRPP